jgi:hypothetical protein
MTTKNTIVLELDGAGAGVAERLVITPERPAIFKTWREFEVAMFGFSVCVANHLRRLSPGRYMRFSELTETQRYAQLVLTGAREIGYIGEAQGPGQAVTHRIPIGDDVWQRVLARGGLPAVKRICDAFIVLFSED